MKRFNEEEYLHYKLRKLRERYEIEAKPIIDRLIKIKQTELPTQIVIMQDALGKGK